MLLITIILGVSGFMFYVLFKPINPTKRVVQIANTLENESNGFIPKVPYHEANHNA